MKATCGIGTLLRDHKIPQTNFSPVLHRHRPQTAVDMSSWICMSVSVVFISVESSLAHRPFRCRRQHERRHIQGDAAWKIQTKMIKITKELDSKNQTSTRLRKNCCQFLFITLIHICSLHHFTKCLVNHQDHHLHHTWPKEFEHTKEHNKVREKNENRIIIFIIIIIIIIIITTVNIVNISHSQDVSREIGLYVVKQLLQRKVSRQEILVRGTLSEKHHLPKSSWFLNDQGTRLPIQLGLVLKTVDLHLWCENPCDQNHITANWKESWGLIDASTGPKHDIPIWRGRAAREQGYKKHWKHMWFKFKPQKL